MLFKVLVKCEGITEFINWAFSLEEAVHKLLQEKAKAKRECKFFIVDENEVLVYETL